MNRCAACEQRRETTYVQRFGGGTYRRAGRWYRTQICSECAQRLLDAATPGHSKSSRFGVTDLRLALQRLNKLEESPQESVAVELPKHESA